MLNFKREEIMAQVQEVPVWIQAGSVLLVMLYMTFQVAVSIAPPFEDLC